MENAINRASFLKGEFKTQELGKCDTITVNIVSKETKSINNIWCHYSEGNYPKIIHHT